MNKKEKASTFWEHLEELRWVIFRIAIVVLSCMLVAFVNKDFLFGIILARLLI